MYLTMSKIVSGCCCCCRQPTSVSFKMVQTFAFSSALLPPVPPSAFPMTVLENHPCPASLYILVPFCKWFFRLSTVCIGENSFPYENSFFSISMFSLSDSIFCEKNWLL
ncbi:hypothetical protein V8G54_031863 [Vigna mungo]|uniref:Uncharacterized protein n=1 Tax=Vigna mungo TaxID=3915 RepID=A0AAQ3MKX1_VIGMU